MDLDKSNAELDGANQTFHILICWLSLSCSHQKAFAHSAALLDLIAVLNSVTELYQTMPIIYKRKHIRDLDVKKKKNGTS